MKVFYPYVLCVTDEREDVQKKTFTKWVNSQLLKVRHLTSFFIFIFHFLSFILPSYYSPIQYCEIKCFNDFFVEIFQPFNIFL